MSIFKLIIVVALFNSTAIYAEKYNVDLNAPAVLDDFNDAYGDNPNQNTIGAVYGIISKNNSPWLGGGYWYVFYDTDGSSIKNSAGEAVISSSNEATMIPDSSLHASLSSISTNQYPYAGIGCNLISDDKPATAKYLDLTKMTAVSMKVKGSGKVRMHFETKDFADAKYDWGYYGYEITLTNAWTIINIPVADLKPEQNSSGAKWTWDHGKTGVNKFTFEVKDKNEAELYVDDIKFVGMTYRDFNFPVTRVISSKAVKESNGFSVSASSISFKLKQAQNMTISLSDIMGNQIRTLFTGNTSAQTFNLNSQNLSSGRYMVVISGENVKYSQPIVVMK